MLIATKPIAHAPVSKEQGPILSSDANHVSSHQFFGRTNRTLQVLLSKHRVKKLSLDFTCARISDNGCKRRCGKNAYCNKKNSKCQCYRGFHGNPFKRCDACKYNRNRTIQIEKEQVMADETVSLATPNGL